jgi:hypothetical protein
MSYIGYKEKDMVNGRPLKVLCLFVLVLALFAACPSGAQENYPLPAGPPDTWGQGAQERLLLKGKNETPAGLLSALPPRGNEAQEQPQAPSGEAQEVYTGTRTLGGPDSRMDQPGTSQFR